VGKALTMHKTKMKNIVESSVQKTFSSFFKFDPKLVSVQLDKARNTDFKRRSISGVMALIENKVKGTFSIGLSKESALKLISTFYGEKIDSLDDHRVIEGIAEIANVTHGLIKEKLNKQGYRFKMCLPVVVIGANHSAFSQSESPALTLRFDSNVGEIVAEVIIHTAGRNKKKVAG
jgi:CheY-specific phosphatase CheX